MLQILTLPTELQKPIVRGDTWAGIKIFITKNDLPVDISGASIRLHLYHNCGSKIELETPDEITIVNGVNGEIQINSIERLDWKIGRHVGDLEITYSNNVRTTYIQVHIVVTEDITK